MIRLRYIDPNGDAIETGSIIKEVGINLESLTDNRYHLIIRYNTVLRTGKIDYIQPVADEMHIILQEASREDIHPIIDAIRTEISDTMTAISQYQNKRFMSVEMGSEDTFDEITDKPKEYVDLNQVLEPWL